MPKKSMRRLAATSTISTRFFIQTSEDSDYIWGMYFMPALLEEKIDGVFASLYFERTVSRQGAWHSEGSDRDVGAGK